MISVGDTPSCSVIDIFEGIDEIRPGNFVFYDAMQYMAGVCNWTDIAIAMACPVVAKHENRGEVVIYGGAVHLSKDFIQNSKGEKVFGLVVQINEHGWTGPLANTFIKSLSQEHGLIKMPNKIAKEIKTGDVLGILPVHSCLTADLMRKYVTLESGTIYQMPKLYGIE